MIKDSLELHLWGYRPRITLEHLIRYMQQQKKKFPILESFVKNVRIHCSSQTFCTYFLLQEAVLQATQYIPNIVKLQKQLFDELHHRIDRRVPQRLSMNRFILKQHTGTFVYYLNSVIVWYIFSESVRNEYREMVSSVHNAWVLVRDQLKEHGNQIFGSL